MLYDAAVRIETQVPIIPLLIPNQMPAVLVMSEATVVGPHHLVVDMVSFADPYDGCDYHGRAKIA